MSMAIASRAGAIVLVSALAIPAFAAAQSQQTPQPQPKTHLLDAGVGVSTLGVTADVTHDLTPNIAAELMVGGFNFSRNATNNGATYQGTIKNFAVGALLRYQPRALGGLYLSGGIINTDYQFSGSANNVTINSVTSSLDVTVKQKQTISPIVKLGYRFFRGSRLHVDLSVGAIFGRGFNVNGNDPTGTFTTAQIDQQLATARSDAKKAKIIPFLNLGVEFRF